MSLLGELERAVMEILWHRPAAASVRDVHAELAPHRDLAYTTVMTVLDRLAKKGVCTRQLDGRAWLYLPAKSCIELHVDEVLDLIEGCSPTGRLEILERVGRALASAD